MENKYIKKLSLEELKEIKRRIIEEQTILLKEYYIINKEIKERLINLYEI